MFVLRFEIFHWDRVFMHYDQRFRYRKCKLIMQRMNDNRNRLYLLTNDNSRWVIISKMIIIIQKSENKASEYYLNCDIIKRTESNLKQNHNNHLFTGLNQSYLFTRTWQSTFIRDLKLVLHNLRMRQRLLCSNLLPNHRQ